MAGVACIVSGAITLGSASSLGLDRIVGLKGTVLGTNGSIGGTTLGSEAVSGDGSMVGGRGSGGAALS